MDLSVFSFNVRYFLISRWLGQKTTTFSEGTCMDNSYVELSRVGKEHVKLLVREVLVETRKESRITFAIGIFRFVAEMMVAVGVVRYFG